MSEWNMFQKDAHLELPLAGDVFFVVHVRWAEM